jgi:DNA-directed RNA polymerase alpha subunit
MKITIEITDNNEFIKLREWLNTMPDIEGKKFDLNQSINLLELSIRSQNYLRSENIETIGDLIKWSEIDLLRNRLIGKKTLCEIKNALSRFGLSLRDDHKSLVSK